ncbi:MAG: hypothetical protein NTX73_01560 [Rhodobacterales bacterium]|nr:hypothetical protein [Rhodobacterales bacterium]
MIERWVEELHLPFCLERFTAEILARQLFIDEHLEPDDDLADSQKPADVPGPHSKAR